MALTHGKAAGPRRGLSTERGVQLRLRAGGLLVPGHAGGALINRIRLDATDPIVMVEASLLVRY